jgi:hypothetical protein
VFAGDFGVLVGLHVDEEHVTEPERARQAQRGVGADPPLAVDNFVDSPWWHVDRLGDPVLRDPIGSRNSVIRISPGWVGAKSAIGFSSLVVVDEFDISGPGCAPGEADGATGR